MFHSEEVLLSVSGQFTLTCAIALVMVVKLFIAALAFVERDRTSSSPRWQRIEDISMRLIANDPGQRVIILRHLVGLANCLAGLVALNYGVQRGAVDPVGCAWLTYSALTVISVVSVILKSGLNRRFSDPSLMTVHILFAVFFLAWGYHLGGPCRTVALMLMIVVLLSNFFISTMKVIKTTSIFAVTLFGAVMAHVAWTERNLRNGPQIQLVNFCVLLIILFSVYLLASHLKRIRDTSEQRKSELVAAMARIQEMAIRDELTKLFNRHHMQEVMESEKSRCNRTGGNFCLGLIDIDHFKRINDTYGHGVGDQVLKSVANLLKDGVRDIDVVARWGGEEFLIMFPGADCDKAEMVLGRLLKILQSSIICPTHSPLRVTFSAGLAQSKAGELLERMVERADLALYQAKRSGRNRVTCATDGQTDGPASHC